MAQLIQFKRRIPGAGPPGTLAAGEPAVAITAAGVADLWVGDGTTPRVLVSDARQVELDGPQTIIGAKTIGAAGSLTTPVANIHIQGGASGNFLTTNGSGVNSWAPVPAAGIPGFSATDTYAVGDHVTYNGHIYRASTANGPGAWDGDDWDRILNESDIDGQLLSDLHIAAPLSGNGLNAGTPLTVTPATAAQATAGTDNVNPITSLRLREKMGLDVASLTTNAKTVVPAINELEGEIAAVTGAVRFIGGYDVPADEMSTGAGSPATDGDPLPAADPTNEGWYFIVETAGTGINNAPHVAMAAGDWIVSNGTSWIHIPLHHAAVTAANVGLTAVNGQTWTNVQAGIQGLFTRFNTAGNAAVLADHVSVLGDGTSFTPLSATQGELRVGTVDGGTF